MRRLRVLAGILATAALAGIASEPALGISRGELQGILEREMDSVGGASGAYVYNVEAGRNPLLYADSKRRSRSLASNTKLFTTAAYLERFGGGGRLETRVFAKGTRTGGDERTLRGSLVLVGGGDPALATPRFAKRKNLPLTSLEPLAKAVKEAGIKTVTGNRGTKDGRYADNPPKEAGKELVAELRKRGVHVGGKAKSRWRPQPGAWLGAPRRCPIAPGKGARDPDEHAGESVGGRGAVGPDDRRAVHAGQA